MLLREAVDDADLGQRHVRERLQDLPRELAHEGERHAPEVRPLQQLVQVEGEVLEHEARVPVVIELLHEPYCMRERGGAQHTAQGFLG